MFRRHAAVVLLVLLSIPASADGQPAQAYTGTLLVIQGEPEDGAAAVDYVLADAAGTGFLLTGEMLSPDSPLAGQPVVVSGVETAGIIAVETIDASGTQPTGSVPCPTIAARPSS